jgi:aminopeptidase N
VAHQWWGIGVDYATYHDRWLSEGLASFAGLWYLQTSSTKEPKRYFDMLDRWRSDVMLRRERGDPVWLGNRVGSASEAGDYQALVYYKGAWIMHMLRVLMLDLKTMSEDRFSNAIRDFYMKYEGQRASTEDLRRTFERHSGADLGWFFEQWVYRSEIPTYKVAWMTEPAEGGKHRVKLRVEQANVPNDFQMYVPVTLDLGANTVARLRVRVAGPRTELELPLMPSKPRDLKFNDLSGVLGEVRNASW